MFCATPGLAYSCNNLVFYCLVYMILGTGSLGGSHVRHIPSKIFRPTGITQLCIFPIYWRAEFKFKPSYLHLCANTFGKRCLNLSLHILWVKQQNRLLAGHGWQTAQRHSLNSKPKEVSLKSLWHSILCIQFSPKSVDSSAQAFNKSYTQYGQGDQLITRKCVRRHGSPGKEVTPPG